MPNRMMRDSCRTSTTLDTLSSDAERLFWRLVTVADDYGRLEADPRIMLAQAFPLRVGAWKPAQVARWFAELVAAGILRRYDAGGKALAYFVTWDKHQRVRAKESKFGPPPDTFAQPSESAALSDDSTCQQMTANVAVVEDVDERRRRETRDEDGRRPARRPAAEHEARFARFYEPYPRHEDRAAALKAWTKLDPDDVTLERIVRDVTTRAWPDERRFVPLPTTYLNRRRWEDDAAARADPVLARHLDGIRRAQEYAKKREAEGWA